MCTLVLAWRCFDQTPVAVGANRDEQLGRASEPPGTYATDPLVIAPRDAEAGGTWIGMNEHGVVAGLTNRWTDTDLAGERSRGTLVTRALEHTSARSAAAAIEETTATVEYDGFSLVVADPTDAIYLSWEGHLERTALEPGVHVVVNVGYDKTFDIPSSRRNAGLEQARNARRVRERLAVAPADVDGTRAGASADRPPLGDGDVTQWVKTVKKVLGDHEYGVCIHGDGFGTRSSSLLTVGTETNYRFADGPPCRHAYQPVDCCVDLEGQF